MIDFEVVSRRCHATLSLIQVTIDLIDDRRCWQVLCRGFELGEYNVSYTHALTLTFVYTLPVLGLSLFYVKPDAELDILAGSCYSFAVASCTITYTRS
jgi:hypothetical protein